MDLNATGEGGVTGIIIKRNKGKCCTHVIIINQHQDILALFALARNKRDTDV
jgi:hypothetical protein